jgi:hypothetical protein
MVVMILRLYLLFWTLLEAGVSCKSIVEQLPFRPANSNQPYLDDSFDNDAKESLEQWKVPGLSIAVVDGDSVCSKVFTRCST